jgi:hypothetical protein
MKLTSHPVRRDECLALLNGGFPVAIETHNDVRLLGPHTWTPGSPLVITDERGDRWTFAPVLWRHAGHSMPAVADGVRAPVYGHRLT